MVDEDPAQLNLDVYDSRGVLWHPERGEVTLPEGWTLLPSGDAFLTRHVKAAGVYWTVWRPRGRNREHRRKIGVLAPVDAIEAAQVDANATDATRRAQRAVGARQRDRAESVYRDELAAAVVHWLDFAPQHRALADEIGKGAASQAAVVGSGRVGRTKTLGLEERAALAARAFIRHHHTDYDEVLEQLDPLGGDLDHEDYRDVKRLAHEAVDQFLDAHRR